LRCDHSPVSLRRGRAHDPDGIVCIGIGLGELDSVPRRLPALGRVGGEVVASTVGDAPGIAPTKPDMAFG
jgi:hypothetical protein